MNEYSALGSLDMHKLAKYMRCLFQIAISDNYILAEQLLQQVCAHAERIAEVSFSRFPLYQHVVLMDYIGRFSVPNRRARVDCDKVI